MLPPYHRSMPFPIEPPIAPMLAKPTPAIPTGDGWIYEPKWDGFRALVFRDGDEVYVQSRDLKPLNRYFPELEEPLRAVGGTDARFVLDGEVVIATPDGGLDFDALLIRIHPAASRVKMLSEASPASFVAFACLADGTDDLRERPFAERRARLASLVGTAHASVRLTPSSTDPAVAQHWFEVFEGAGLDGVIAKRGEDAYAPGKRTMAKIKHARTADCVVAGFRWHKSGPVVGSLLLGLYDDAGTLQHIGVAASFTMARRAELVEELAPYRADALSGHPWQDWANADTTTGAEGAGAAGEHRMPGATSRWNAGKDLSWVPLRPELVVEIKYDQLEGSRLRHTGHFLRWRPDRDAASCTYHQLDIPVRYDLAEVLGG
jgi:ATP-dependent DNA ligase